MRRDLPKRTHLLPAIALAVLAGLLLGCPAAEDGGDAGEETAGEAAGSGMHMDAMDHADPGHLDDEPHGGMVHGEADPAGPVDHEAETDPEPLELDEVVEEAQEGDDGGAERNDG